MKMNALVTRILGAGLLLCAAACSQTMTAPIPSSAAVLSLRNDFPAMRVGAFAPGPGTPVNMDSSVSSRSVLLGSPVDGSFSKYLGSVIETDLKAAGKLDPQSAFVISGLLTRSDLNTGMSTGEGSLAAQFTLRKSGTTIFEKTLETRAEWESSFIGAVAIPAAINGYTSLYGKLVDQLMADPELKAAVKK